MHEYAYRCERCSGRFVLRYARYADYDAAEKRCPECDSAEITRILVGVGQQRRSGPAGQRDYAALSAQEMLSVLETGDARETKRLYDAVDRSTKR